MLQGILNPTRLAVFDGAIQITVEYDRSSQHAPRVPGTPDDTLLSVDTKMQKGSVVLVVFMACNGEFERPEFEAPVGRKTYLFASVEVRALVIRNLECQLCVVFHDIFRKIAIREFAALHTTRDRRSNFVELAGDRTAGSQGNQRQQPKNVAHFSGRSPLDSQSFHGITATDRFAILK
jgi:hypothetical protein